MQPRPSALAAKPSLGRGLPKLPTSQPVGVLATLPAPPAHVIVSRSFRPSRITRAPRGGEAPQAGFPACHRRRSLAPLPLPYASERCPRMLAAVAKGPLKRPPAGTELTAKRLDTFCRGSGSRVVLSLPGRGWGCCSLSLHPDILPLGDFNLPKAEPGDPVYNALTRRGLHLPEHSTKIGSSIAADEHYDQIVFFPGDTKVLQRGPTRRGLHLPSSGRKRGNPSAAEPARGRETRRSDRATSKETTTACDRQTARGRTCPDGERTRTRGRCEASSRLTGHEPLTSLPRR